MPADKEVISLLNQCLAAELTAINQYFLHAELCSHWGYKKLHGFIRMQAIDEMRHAEQLLERILFLDGMPNMQLLSEVNIGQNVKEMFAADLALEKDAIPRLARGVTLCTERNDHGTRAMLEEILKSEEQHLDWIDEQLRVLDAVGEPNYLTLQIQTAAPTGAA